MSGEPTCLLEQRLPVRCASPQAAERQGEAAVSVEDSDRDGLRDRLDFEKAVFQKQYLRMKAAAEAPARVVHLNISSKTINIECTALLVALLLLLTCVCVHVVKTDLVQPLPLIGSDSPLL